MVLVSGATGLLGGHLLYRFRESATTTTALYRTKDNIENTRLIFESYCEGHGKLVDQFNWMPADLLEIPTLDAAMEGINTVYHCAASMEADSFQQMKINNITGTENIINVALFWGVKHFCHVSSISALGESIGNRPINETDFFNLDALNTDYAISKFGAEMEAWRATQEGIRVVIINPGIILGEGNWDNGSGKFFSKTLSGNTYYTTGKSGFVDVRDVTLLMIRLMNSEVQNDRFIIVAENLSYREILNKIADALRVSRPRRKLSKFTLNVISFFSYVLNLIGLTKKLKRSTIKSLTSSTDYENNKIKDVLNIEFTPVDKTIHRIAAFLLKNSNN
jgi:nucleoside-diphosphate-sugar epimerase